MCLDWSVAAIQQPDTTLYHHTLRANALANSNPQDWVALPACARWDIMKAHGTAGDTRCRRPVARRLWSTRSAGRVAGTNRAHERVRRAVRRPCADRDSFANGDAAPVEHTGAHANRVAVGYRDRHSHAPAHRDSYSHPNRYAHTDAQPHGDGD